MPQRRKHLCGPAVPWVRISSRSALKPQFPARGLLSTAGNGASGSRVQPVKSVLVTGASSGIGRATALHLDSLGWRVFAGVRKEKDAKALRTQTSDRFAVVLLDITDDAAVASAAEEIEEALGGGALDGLVNNAGLAIPGPLECLPMDEFRAQIDVNLTAQVAVTQAMLPMLRRGKGRIVFITSIGGRIAFPYMGPYHASKFGLEAVGDCLRQELRPWGLEVVIVEPGSVATDIWARGDAKGDEILEKLSPRGRELYESRLQKMRKTMTKTGDRGVEPQVVADVIEDALTAGKPKKRYLVGRDAKIQARVKKFIPDRIFDVIVARTTGTG